MWTIVFVLLSGCDLWRFDLCRPHGLHLSLLGNLRPLSTHQPHLPHRGVGTAALSQLHIPRAGPLQHHARRYHHHPRGRGWILSGILGERAARADFWAPGPVACTATHTDSSCTGSKRSPLPGRNCGTTGNTTDSESTESAGVIFMVQSAKKWWEVPGGGEKSKCRISLLHIRLLDLFIVYWSIECSFCWGCLDLLTGDW